MTDHQKRILKSMINEIQNYLDGKNEDFYGLVGRLEGALDAADIKNDPLINQWYDFWTPLEIRRSIEGNDVNKQKAINELIKMKLFLLNISQY